MKRLLESQISTFLIVYSCLNLPVFYSNIVQAQSAWRPVNPYTSNYSLKVGDVITVLVEENLAADYAFESERSDKLTVKSIPDKEVTKFLPGIENSKAVNRKKKGRSQGGSRIKGSLSVLVIADNANGTYQIGGTKILTFDGESNSMQIRGIINPRDIKPGYRISSAKIANLAINFQGQIVKKRLTLKDVPDKKPAETTGPAAPGQDITKSPEDKFISEEDKKAILKRYVEEIMGEFMDENNVP